MYKYGLQGWRPDYASAAPKSVLSNVCQTSVSACDMTSTTAVKDVDHDDGTDELNDIAAPLPVDGDETSSDQHCGKSHGGRLLAKDKRKLREKRRSTGVVNYISAPEEENIENCDLETSRNTSFNEAASDIQLALPSKVTDRCHDVTAAPEIQTSSLPSCDTCRVTAAPTADVTVSSQTSSCDGHVTMNKPVSAGHVESIRGTLTARSVPSIAPKPRHIENSFPRSVLHKAPETSRWKPETKNMSESERVLLNKRIAELEKMLDDERMENTRLQDQLSAQQSRIVDLQTEVDALNQDLDLADDDYAKLEEENRVLLRAMSQMSSE